MSDRRISIVQPNVPPILVGRRRTAVALAMGALGAVLLPGFPKEVRLVAAFDITAAVYLAMVCAMTLIATPEQAASLSQREERSGYRVLLAAIVLSFASVAALAAMLDASADASHWMHVAHMTGSLLALFLSWMVLHVIFGLHYMNLYYGNDQRNVDDLAVPMLEFPNKPMPDFADFMYFSFTIAMCYQTSDVSINGANARLLTLLHAILSFFHVAIIIGFVVNILSNLT